MLLYRGPIIFEFCSLHVFHFKERLKQNKSLSIGLGWHWQAAAQASQNDSHLHLNERICAGASHYQYAICETMSLSHIIEEGMRSPYTPFSVSRFLSVSFALFKWDSLSSITTTADMHHALLRLYPSVPARTFRMHISHSHIEHVLPARVKFAALMIIKAELILTITHTLVIIPQTVSHLLWGKWRDSFPHSRVVSDGCKGIRKCLWPSSRYRAWHSSFWMQSYQNRAKRMKNRYYMCPKNRDATRRRNEGAHSSFIAVPDAPRLFIWLFYQFQAAPYFFLRPLPTLSIDSLLIIYHTGQSVLCIIAGAPHDNGWMKLSCLYTK